MFKNNQSRHIIIAAGGTGGHIFPAIATCAELQKAGFTVSWLGTCKGLEYEIVPKHGIEIDYIEISGIRKKSLMHLLKVPKQLFSAVWQSLKIFKRRRPALILGMGGFVSGPAGIAARLAGIPLVIHEQNAIAGFTNKVLARIAKKVMISFPDTFPKHIKPVLTGNPIRKSLINIESPTKAIDNTQSLNILIFGGSQGASVFHRVVPSALAQLSPNIELNVLHQAGARFLEQAKTAYASTSFNVEVVPFIDDMAQAYAGADLVIARAGALTVAELAVVGVGAILVPFPFAVDDHQTSNSQFLAKNGAAILVQERDFTVDWLQAQITRLIENREELLRMAQAAKALGQIDAAEKVANHCLEVCRGGSI